MIKKLQAVVFNGWNEWWESGEGNLNEGELQNSKV